jgi:glycosyltransferase involved in cell wall biosynthesis
VHHDELKNIYQKASVFVLPSYMDSWGQVVCEAMACGTPVIVSQNTGSKDVVEDGENGFIVDVANRKQLEEKISYFYHNRSELERMGKNARKSVEHLTWENYYDQINQIIVKIESKDTYDKKTFLS